MKLFFNLNVKNVFDNMLHLRLLYNIKKKNFRQIVKMNKNFFEKQKHDINYRKSHDNKTQNQRKYITKFIILFNIVFILQREFVKII